MHAGAPIPETAQFDDPLWTSRFLDLAHAMIMLDGKPKLIARYTGLSAKSIADRYKRLTGHEAPAGRLQQAQPKHFAIPHNRGGLDWNIQAAAFAAVYLKIEAALDEPPNRGWLLTAAFQAYQRLTDPILAVMPDLPRVGFNTGYDLMTHLGYGYGRKSAALALKQCDVCGASHLIITTAELDNQSCPMCAIQRRYALLVENASRIQSCRRARAT